jgi:large subunit ribosomal protein L5
MFAEIDPDKADQPRGMDVTIVTTAHDNDTAKALLEAYGFPFKKGADADNEPRKKKSRGPRYGGKKK